MYLVLTWLKIYVNDLLNYIEIDEDTPSIQVKSVGCLLYADHLELLSKSVKRLQK